MQKKNIELHGRFGNVPSLTKLLIEREQPSCNFDGLK
jgi:hypothetical protein